MDAIDATTLQPEPPGGPGGPGPECLGLELARLRPRLRRVAQRFAPDGDAAEDIVQNACEKAVRHAHRFRGEARLATWLYRIVVNEALMWLRSERRRSRRRVDLGEDGDGYADVEAGWIAPGPRPDEQLALDRRHARLRACIDALPPEEREVVLRCALAGDSYEQLGAERGVAAGALKSRAFRARRRMRAMLAESTDRPSPEALSA